MSFLATASTAEPRSFSIGPIKVQIFTYTAVSGDVSGTITAAQMQDRVTHIIMDGGLQNTAAPTFSGNVVTLAFTDPAANAFGTIMVFGI